MLIFPQTHKGAACVSPGDRRGPGVGFVPLHVAVGAEERSAILETAHLAQMGVCGPGECGRWTEELRKVESGMGKTGEEDWTTS